GRLPHLLELELFDARLVWRDGRALDGNAVLLAGIGGVDRDLVVGLVAILHAEVVVFEVHVEVGVDQLVLDELPDDARHLIAVHLDDGAGNLDLLHVANPSMMRASTLPSFPRSGSGKTSPASTPSMRLDSRSALRLAGNDGDRATP